MGRGNLSNRRRSVALAFVTSAVAVTWLSVHHRETVESACTDTSAYLDSLCYDDMREEFNARDTGLGDAILPDAEEHEAAAPTISSSASLGTQTDIENRLSGTPGSRITLTGNVAMLHIGWTDHGEGTDWDVTDCEIDLAGYTIQNILKTNGSTLTRVRFKNGTIGQAFWGNTTTATDVSFVGIAFNANDAAFGDESINITNHLRLTFADCVGVGKLNQAIALLSEIEHVAILNSSFGANTSSTANSWTFRWNNTTHATFVNSYFRGAQGQAVMRQATASGFGAWSVPSDWNADNSLVTAFINTAEEAMWCDVGGPGIDTDHMGASRIRVEVDNTGTSSNNLRLGWDGTTADAWTVWWVRYRADTTSMVTQAILDTKEATAIAASPTCDADYGESTGDTPNTFAYQAPLTPTAPPTTRDSYILGTTVEGNPYNL